MNLDYLFKVLPKVHVWWMSDICQIFKGCGKNEKSVDASINNLDITHNPVCNRMISLVSWFSKVFDLFQYFYSCSGEFADIIYINLTFNIVGKSDKPELPLNRPRLLH